MLVIPTPLLPLFLCFLTSSTISADLLLCHNHQLLAFGQICQPGTWAVLEVFVLNFLRFPTWQILNLTEMQTLNKNSDQTLQRSPLLPDINIVESPCVGRRNRQGPLGLAAYNLLAATRTLGQRNTTLEFSGMSFGQCQQELKGGDLQCGFFAPGGGPQLNSAVI